MSKDQVFIRSMDEGHSVIADVEGLPCEDKGNTALMVNPAASVRILIDSARTRAARVEGITRAFHFLTDAAIADIPEDAVRDMFQALNGISHEAIRLLDVAQVKAGGES